MKKILSLVFVFSALCGSQAFATYDNCIHWSTINVNSGHTSKSCDDDVIGCSLTECTVSSLGTLNAVVTTGSCPLGTTYYTITATGKNCCIKGTVGSACLDRNQQQLESQHIQTTSDNSNLENVFGDRSIAYFGFIDNGNRSPNAGRAVSIDARLDACLGSGVVDTYVTSYTGCISSCNDSTKNGYCTATVTNNTVADANGVCHDRCECKYGMGGTCDNL